MRRLVDQWAYPLLLAVTVAFLVLVFGYWLGTRNGERFTCSDVELMLRDHGHVVCLDQAEYEHDLHERAGHLG